MLVFLFKDRILFRAVDTKELMDNPLGTKKTNKGEFKSIVRPKLFYTFVELSLHKGKKLWNNTSSIRLVFEKKYPCITGAVIYKR